MCIDWCGSPADKSVQAAQQAKTSTKQTPKTTSRASPPQTKPASTAGNSKTGNQTQSTSPKPSSPKPSTKKETSTKKLPAPGPAPLCSQGLADVCIDDSWMGGGGSVDGKGKPRNEIAAEIGKWAGIVADVIGFVPSFLCLVCTGASFMFGLLSVLGYALAKMWEKAIAVAVATLVGAVVGKAGAKVMKEIVQSYGSQMVYFAKHHANLGQRLPRGVPTSIRVKVDWLMTTITGTISAAFSAIATM